MENMILARPYAKAIFNLALQSKQLELWNSALQTLAIVELEAAGFSDQEFLFTIIEKMQVQDLQPALVNLVKLLRENKKLNIIPAIASSYQKLFFEHEKILEVKIVVAQELSLDQQNKLIKALQVRYQREIILKCQVNAEIIGGAVVYAANEVIDGSVKGALTQLRHEVLC